MGEYPNNAKKPKHYVSTPTFLRLNLLQFYYTEERSFWQVIIYFLY